MTNNSAEQMLIEDSMQIIIRGIIGQVQEQTDILHGSIFFKVLFEETSCFHVYLLSITKNKHKKITPVSHWTIQLNVKYSKYLSSS